MKILFVLGLEVNPKVGGVERVTYVLSRYFIDAGIEVSYLYFTIKELSFPQYNEQVQTFFLPDSAAVKSNENVAFLKNVIEKEGVNIVINQGYTGSAVTELIARSSQNTTAKVISILHNKPFQFSVFYGQYKQILTNYLALEKRTVKTIFKKQILVLLAYKEYVNFYKRYLKMAFVSSDKFVLLSSGYIPLFNKILKLKASDKLIALANPLSFSNNYSKVETGKKNQVIYVGRLEYNQKRLDRLIDAWSLIENDAPGWTLIIIGGSMATGDNENDYQTVELKRLQKQISNLKLKNIIFAGNTNPETYYKESKLFSLTSSYEGFPLVLGEAMQYGVVPVVFGSFEAAYDIINHGVNGLIAQPFDIPEYARLLKEAMVNETKTEQMSINAISSSAKFSLESVGNQWINLFRELAI